MPLFWPGVGSLRMGPLRRHHCQDAAVGTACIGGEVIGKTFDLVSGPGQGSPSRWHLECA